MDRLVRWGGLLLRAMAALFLVLMMLATVVDILARHVFSAPISGTVDIVEFTLVYLVFLGIPLTFAVGEHIVVDVLDEIAPGWLVAWLDKLALWVSMLLMGLLCYAMWTPFQDTWAFGDRTMDLRIPLVWHWLAIWIGAVFSTLILLLRVLRRSAAVSKPLSHE